MTEKKDKFEFAFFSTSNFLQMIFTSFFCLLGTLRVLNAKERGKKGKIGCDPAELAGYGTFDGMLCRRWKGYFESDGKIFEKNKARVWRQDYIM